jgi:hypothetical protein
MYPQVAYLLFKYHFYLLFMTLLFRQTYTMTSLVYEARLEAMALSDPTNCFIQICVQHLPVAC